MKNLILEANALDNAIPFIVFGVLILIAVLIFVIMTKGKKKALKSKKQKNISDVDTKKSMALKIPFLNGPESNFLRNFQSILPDEYVVYPKISMEKLVVPYNNKEFYDIVKYKKLDFVVFLKRNMQPVVVIDLHDRTGVQKSIEEDDKFLAAALRNVGLPVVDYEVRQEYEPAELLGKFLDALDPIAIANLKKNKDRYKS